MDQETSSKAQPKAKWREFLDRVEVKVAIKTAVAGGLAWAVGLGFSQLIKRPDTLISGLWCTMTAIVVVQAHLGGTYKAAWHRFLGVFVGSIMGGLCTTLLDANPLSLGISVFLTIIVCSLANIKDSIRIACLSVCAVMVLWGLHRSHDSPWVFALFRFLDSCLGILVAVLVTHALWPVQATRKLQLNMAHILTCLSQLYRMTVQADRLIDNNAEKDVSRIGDEITSLIIQNRSFLDEARVELLTNPERLKEYTDMHNSLRHLSVSIRALHQIYNTPFKIFDPGLSVHVEAAVETLDACLGELSHLMIAGIFPESYPDLEVVKNQLHEDLGRFRATRTTRQFNLQEVESFFVFFYSINALIEEVQCLVQQIDTLNKNRD
jgi:uncharacterized membrane protein YgaE (UPF0421/DUF939 family)